MGMQNQHNHGRRAAGAWELYNHILNAEDGQTIAVARPDEKTIILSVEVKDNEPE